MAAELGKSTKGDTLDPLDMKNAVEIPLTDEAAANAGADQKSQQQQQNKKKLQINWKFWEFFNWEPLKTPRSVLKIGQVLFGTIFLATIHRPIRHYLNRNFPDYLLLFVAYNVTVVTLVLLIDSLVKAQPLRASFTPRLWARLELWLTGLVALVFHVLAFRVGALSELVNYYLEAGVAVVSLLGFLTAAFYLADWWRMFRAKSDKTIAGTTSSSFEKIVVECS